MLNVLKSASSKFCIFDFSISSEPNNDRNGQRIEAEEALTCYNRQTDSGTNGNVVGSSSLTNNMAIDDEEWVRQLSRECMCAYQFHGLQGIEQQQIRTDFLTGQERNIETIRNSASNFQGETCEASVSREHETNIEPQQCAAPLPQQVVSPYSHFFVRESPEHTARAVTPQEIKSPSPHFFVRGSSERTAQAVTHQEFEAPTDTTGLEYIDQNPTSALEFQPNQPVQPNESSTVMFEEPRNQDERAHHPHPVSMSQSRPCSPAILSSYPELDSESPEYLQGYDEDEWNEELGDHNYCASGPNERQPIIHEEDQPEQSYLPQHSTLHEPYLPPNLSPTEKKQQLLVDYKNAFNHCLRFANLPLLQANNTYVPIEPFASDLYRFHTRGAHIHGFFRMVIDTRDPPNPDQTRYIQDIRFGNVFPLFPDYEEWNNEMRNEFQQLSNQLMQFFEQKCFQSDIGSGHGQTPHNRRGSEPIGQLPPGYSEQQTDLSGDIPRSVQSLRSSITPQMGSVSSRPFSSHAVNSTHTSSSTTMLRPFSRMNLITRYFIHTEVTPHTTGLSPIRANEQNSMRLSSSESMENFFSEDEEDSSDNLMRPSWNPESCAVCLGTHSFGTTERTDLGCFQSRSQSPRPSHSRDHEE
ncbi:hypothetical protein DICVIV_13395 [Dictyocaulus viviparus]|uniref:Uncharacterized protein n=1 Tax=Dictyocaulus viviparus TaxID=29172 RepID=A0A0D8XDY4_DICVI|nr:hypothetical protein DICVIV_13395 [Dictyocaulus viviparus]